MPRECGSPARQQAFALRPAADMSSTDGTGATSEAVRRRRRRSNTLLLILAAGFLVFAAAAGALYYALRPVTLRIAVGPAGSDDHKVIQAAAEAFASESRTVRLSVITTEGAVEALGLLGAGKAQLAVGRADLDMPADAQTVATLRKNFVVLWSPSGLAGKSSRRKPAAKIKEIADLAGHRVGVIGRTPANVALLRVILSACGVEADKVAVTQFGTDQIEQLASDKTLDAFMTVGPLDSKITSQAIAATARARGEPKFLAIDASEAIALKDPRYESEEIPPQRLQRQSGLAGRQGRDGQRQPPDRGAASLVRNDGSGLLPAIVRRPAGDCPARARRRAHRQAGHRQGRRAAGASRSGGRHRRHRTHLSRPVRRLLLVCPPASLRDRFGRGLAASLFESR